jgi:hypothetical protein
MRNKRMALIIAVVFALSIMLPVTAFAGNPVTFSGAYPIIDDAANQPAGWFKVAKDEQAVLAAANWKTFVTIDLSSGAEWVGDGTDVDTIADVTGLITEAVTVGDLVYDADSLQFSVTGAVYDTLTFNVPNLDIDSGTTGDVTVTVKLQALDNNNNHVWTQTGMVTIAKIGDAKLTATAKDKEVFDAPADNQQAADIVIAENQPGVLDTTAPADEIILEILTDGVTWDAAMSNTAVASGTAGLAVQDSAGNAGKADLDPTNKIATFLVSSSSSGIAGELTIKTYLDIAPNVEGDIEVEVRTNNTDALDDTTLVIGNVGEGVITFETEGVDDVDAWVGRNGVTTGDLVIKQNYQGALKANGSIELTLEGAKWTGNPTSVGGLTAGSRFNDDRSIWFTVTTTNWDEVTLRGGTELPTISVDADAEPGDLKVIISGTAGAAGEVSLGTIKLPASASAEIVEVETAALSQSAGDITITEAEKNVFVAGNLVLTLPNGCDWSAEPTVEINGDELPGGQITISGEQLTINILAGDLNTTKVDVIEITDIEYDVDSRFEARDIEVKISGTSLTGGGSTDTILTVTNATGKVAGVVTTSFTAGDEGVTIVNGRTLVQVNKLCDILGLQKSWDSATKTAYFVKGGKIVAFPMGENAIYINGVKVPVDQGGMIINDYTYATLRGLQMAFDGELEWDDATKTATFTFTK